MAVTEPSGGEARRGTPVHLWIVGGLSLLWHLMGVFDYLATQLQLEFYMSQFTEAQLDYFYGFPAWAVAGWAFGVWGAFAGSIGLLLRRAWARWAFVASIAGMAISSLYTLVLSDGLALMGGPGALAFTVIVWIVAIFLLVYSWKMTTRGVLR